MSLIFFYTVVLLLNESNLFSQDAIINSVQQRIWIRRLVDFIKPNKVKKNISLKIKWIDLIGSLELKNDHDGAIFTMHSGFVSDMLLNAIASLIVNSWGAQLLTFQ